MGSATIALGLGLGGGKASTSSGRLAGGGFTPTALSASVDGTDDFLDVGSSSTLFSTGADFSFSGWVKLDSLSNAYQSFVQLKTNHSAGFQFLISNQSSYTGLNIGSTDIANMVKARTDGDISNTFLSWTHVVLTYNGSGGSTLSNYTCYINGSAVALVSNGNYAPLSNHNTFGMANAGASFPMDGKLDELAIFGVELSSSQVTAIYNSGVPGDLSSLSPVGWWRMGDGTGDTASGGGAPANTSAIGTIVDQGSGGNNATGQNGTTFSNSVPT